MENKDLRILVKEVMNSKGFLNEPINTKDDVWSASDASAWKKFTMNTDGFSFYANKIPSLISLPAHIVEKLTEYHKEVKVKPEVVASKVVTPAPEPVKAPEPIKVEPVKTPEPAPAPEPVKIAEPTPAPAPEPIKVEPVKTPEPEPVKAPEPVKEENSFSDFEEEFFKTESNPSVK